MSRIGEALASKFVLLVSLTRNDPHLARIALENGADAIKVHLNCAHFASGTNFGSWEEEKVRVLEVAQVVQPHIPLGIVTGAEEVPPEADLEDIGRQGFDFWDLFANHLPPAYLDWPKMGRMAAVVPLSRFVTTSWALPLSAGTFTVSVWPSMLAAKPLPSKSSMVG